MKFENFGNFFVSLKTRLFFYTKIEHQRIMTMERFNKVARATNRVRDQLQVALERCRQDEELNDSEEVIFALLAHGAICGLGKSMMTDVR